jgi:3-deoxy-D-manno-octulosonic-acid transferase
MLARWAYSGLLRLATAAYLVRLWWRGRREPLYRHALHERLGFYDGQAVPGALWVHAVSLGETRAAAALIAALRAEQPGLRLLLTHGTATGRAAGAALLRAGDAQAWLPYDTPGAARRFLQHFQPCKGVLLETEIWPNLLHQAHENGLPMVLANARLSQRSANKGRRWQALMRPAVASLKQVLAQTESDAERLRAAGAVQVQVLGNLKFDVAVNTAQLSQGRAWRAALQRPVVLAAATREGEEEALLRAWLQRPAVADVQPPLLLLVPRHPQRFDEVAAWVAELLAAQGLHLARRSSWADTPPPLALAADVWLGDSMGEMALYYGAADVALLGGSFAPLGGQNLIEAAACGCPLVMGPHTFNFMQAAEQSLAAQASVRVADAAQGVEKALALARDPARAEWAARARAFAAQHRGAAAQMAAAVLAA